MKEVVGCLKLVKPTMALVSEYLSMETEEMAADPRLIGFAPSCVKEVEELIQCCEVQEMSGDPSTEGVPQTTFWLVRNESEVVGSCRLRHWLTPQMELLGGHVDYGIRASERRKGYGSCLLMILKEEARKLGIGRLLVICRKDNIGSIGVILNNGGVLESEGINPNTGQVLLRYRIGLDVGSSPDS